MAFLFLFAGLLVGASCVALTDNERYYYNEHRYAMENLGERDGYVIYRDPRTGVYYLDDGWETRKTGTPGFVPHPIDRERLKELSTKYHPPNLRWLDFLLANFEGREQTLWDNFFNKYIVGPKPKEPTWGRGIRKTRWAKYEEQLAEWEARRARLLEEYREENRKWAAKRAQYDAEHGAIQRAISGRELLRRAMSNPGFQGFGAPIMQTPAQQQLYKAVVPEGKRPGDTFLARAGPATVRVTVPPGAYSGMEIKFPGPGIPIAQATYVEAPAIPVAQAVAAPAAVPPALRPAVPPALGAAEPPAARPAPPPQQTSFSGLNADDDHDVPRALR